jgi:excisionase family DNA binding protein
VNHQGGEPDPPREKVNDCAVDEVVRRDSAEELGKRIRVHARTVRNWVLHGCPHVRAGRKLRFREPDVLQWLEERGS